MKPQRAFLLAILAACGASASASTRPERAPRYQPVAEASAKRGEACVPTATRCFIGFSRGMSLNDFDLAATEAKLVTTSLQDKLCARATELEPSGALAADLAAQRMEVFEVQFVRDDAGAADVGLRKVGDATDDRGAYRLAMERGEQGWRLTAIERH